MMMIQSRRRVSSRCFMVAMLACLAMSLSFGELQTGVDAQDDWQSGQLVGLREGTCIREGPGLRYRAHTRVPENDWLVMVIDGPRRVDGRIWYDTSRRAAGDPSGGTGWVDRSQSDKCPSNGDSPRVPPDTGPPSSGSWLRRIQDYWIHLSTLGKWVTAIAVLSVALLLWRKLALSLWTVFSFIVVGAIVWWLMEQTRSVWEPYWHGALGSDAPDLALLLALVPMLGWIVPRLFSFMPRPGR